MPKFVRPNVAQLSGSYNHGVYAFDALTKSGAAALLRRLSKFESEAPNSMNKYGVVLDDVGCSHIARDLLRSTVVPLSRAFFPEVRLRRVYGFLVQYEADRQRSLSAHADESVVTLNICLGEKFYGGELAFLDENGREEIVYPQHQGGAFLHLGSHTHRAKQLKSGRRANLVLWCR